MHPRLANRLLAHSIDATTLSGSRGRGSGLGTGIFVVSLVIATIAFLLWAENKWGWVQ